MQFMQDFRDSTFQRLSYLVGSTEQVSDNIEELTAQERWERDEDVENDLAFILQAEEQLAIRDLTSAHNMFRFTAGPAKERFRVECSDHIRKIRALRFERAQLGGTQ